MHQRTMDNLPPTDHAPQPYGGLPKDEVLKLREQYLHPAIFHYYKEPLMIVEGHMQYVYDETGRRYLDGIGGIVTVSVGHCHPHVTQAAVQQLQTLQHTTTIYLNPVIAEYAEMLAHGCRETWAPVTSSTRARKPMTWR